MKITDDLWDNNCLFCELGVACLPRAQAALFEAHTRPTDPISYLIDRIVLALELAVQRKVYVLNTQKCCSLMRESYFLQFLKASIIVILV